MRHQLSTDFLLTCDTLEDARSTVISKGYYFLLSNSYAKLNLVLDLTINNELYWRQCW